MHQIRVSINLCTDSSESPLRTRKQYERRELVRKHEFIRHQRTCNQAEKEPKLDVEGEWDNPVGANILNTLSEDTAILGLCTGHGVTDIKVCVATGLLQ